MCLFTSLLIGLLRCHTNPSTIYVFTASPKTCRDKIALYPVQQQSGCGNAFAKLFAFVFDHQTELHVWLFSRKCVRQTEGGRCFPVLPEEKATHVANDQAGHIKHTMCTLHVTVCLCEDCTRHLVANKQYFNNINDRNKKRKT